jgi:hypothetical protein
MANGKRFRGSISDRELRRAMQTQQLAGRRSGNGGLQKALGMTQRPTTAGQEVFGGVDVSGGGFRGALSEAEAEQARRNAATTAGQARFGDVDVTGAQTTAREQEGGRLRDDSRFPKTPELTEEFLRRHKEAVAAAEADAARKRGTRRGSR